MNLYYTIIILTCLLAESIGLVSDEISFLVLSQKNKYHSEIAEQLKQNIIEQSLSEQNTSANVYLSHELFDRDNAWALTPILSQFAIVRKKLITSRTKWLLLVEEHSAVNVKSLLLNLQIEDHSSEAFLGYSLFDRDATIIHHFAFFRNPSKFLYPYIRAGVAFSMPLLNKIIDHLASSSTPSPISATHHATDFFIDASHELALFILNVNKKFKLKSVPYFCNNYGDNCSVYARNENIFCNNPVSFDKILFAVKTCEKFHTERLPIVLRTWGKFAFYLRMFSDVQDPSIPTVTTGVENTESGHCAKSMKILKMLVSEIAQNDTLKNIEWVVLADDDVLMSISSLSEYLGCFDINEHIYLGERYGFNLFSKDGYNYITGGGGIVFNVKTLRLVAKLCSCPSISSPDDMIIASCLHSLGVHPIHSSLFHQARPTDYSPDILDINSISFHKHWNIDPYGVYRKWFHYKDEQYYYINKNLQSDCTKHTRKRNQKTIKHIEL